MDEKNHRNFYVTSPIYYVNDIPHIGHAYTSIACDVAARFKRLCGFDVYFVTGTDDHGQKVEKSALASQKKPQEFCDEVSLKFSNLARILNLSNNDFIRTTQERHKKSARKFWEILQQNGWIYKGVYEGWYAVRDEAFYSADELTDGKAPTGAEVTWHKEESYFFKLSAFEQKLLALYEANPDFIRPRSRFNEVLSFVKSGLKDLSVSRTSFSWGIKVSDSQNHVMYVWLDALTNYISALGFADEKSALFDKFWSADATLPFGSPLHIIGKDIVRFHGVYWPAFLMAANLNLPHSVYAHGWWTNEGHKISKSLKNTIDPLEELKWLQSFGCDSETAVDYFRYFLMREVPFGNDGDYSRLHFITRINAELANNIGNLVQRSLSMIFKNNQAQIVDFSDYADGLKLLQKAYELPQKITKKMTNFAFDQAIGEILLHATGCNEFFNDKAPWNLKKANKITEMNLVLSVIAENLRVIAILLQPFCVNLAHRILDILQITDGQFSLGSSEKDSFLEFPLKLVTLENALKPGHKIKEPKAIFPRLAHPPKSDTKSDSKKKP
jgi:methionyl-tRNA synthetase